MKKHHRGILVLLLCFFFNACNSSLNGEEYALSGQVITELPAQSLVEVSSANGFLASASTDGDGFFSMLVLEPPPYYIRTLNGYAPSLKAWCESLDCHITQWSTLIVDLMDEHDFFRASEILKTLTGFGSDPFLPEGAFRANDHDRTQLHEIFRDPFNGSFHGEGSNGVSGRPPFCSIPYGGGSQAQSFCAVPPLEQATSARPAEGIYIANAGLVLASSFYPMLFRKLGIMSGSSFISQSAREDAVYYLQYLTTGSALVDEDRLALNKVLLGINPETSIKRGEEISLAEKLILEQMLSSIIQTWPVMNGSSIESLRGSFLRREGRLVEEKDRWVLTVQRKSLDVLLNSFPYSFSKIFYDWMDKPLMVDWAN